MVSLYQVFRKLDSLFGIHQVDVTVRVARTSLISRGEIVVHGRTSHLTFLGGDHNDTISRFYPVKSRGGSIFQHVNTINIPRIKSSNGVTDPVYIIRVI